MAGKCTTNQSLSKAIENSNPVIVSLFLAINLELIYGLSIYSRLFNNFEPEIIIELTGLMALPCSTRDFQHCQIVDLHVGMLWCKVVATINVG